MHMYYVYNKGCVIKTDVFNYILVVYTCITVSTLCNVHIAYHTYVTVFMFVRYCLLPTIYYPGKVPGVYLLRTTSSITYNTGCIAFIPDVPRMPTICIGITYDTHNMD